MPEAWLKGPLMWAVSVALIITLVGVLVWDLSAEQAEQRIRGEQSTQNHVEYAEDRIDEKCLSLDPMPMRDCIHEEIEAARDHDRANQDLNAQQQMAFFTKVMGWTAVVGLIVGCGSVVLIFLTLRATQEMATDQAKIGSAQVSASLDAIKTAQEANQIMRDDQRPWIKVEFEQKIENKADPVGLGPHSGYHTLITMFSIQNIGGRPAKEMWFDTAFLGAEAKFDAPTPAFSRERGSPIDETVLPNDSLDGFLDFHNDLIEEYGSTVFQIYFVVGYIDGATKKQHMSVYKVYGVVECPTHALTDHKADTADIVIRATGKLIEAY